jgi:flagellar basal-body rod modification protein FlgD
MDIMSDTLSTESASQIQTDYTKLLVTQLQNQNPLEPMDNNQMAAQLAQFSQLQQLENMNTSFSKVLNSVQRSYASSLIGKDVSFQATADDGSVTISTGKVGGVVMGSDGTVQLQIGTERVSLDNVTSIQS